MQLNVIILAAGMGKRMMSDKPKVLHLLAGIPLLQRVINTAEKLNPMAIHVVYGNAGDQVRQSFHHAKVNWVLQAEQHGTGHAVAQALPHCDDNSHVLILYGDVPLISLASLQKLIQQASSKSLSVLTAKAQDPSGLGRIVRNTAGELIKIVEERDADEQQKQITEINTGIMLCPVKQLKHWLPQLTPHNQQKELYLTDVVALAVANNIAVKHHQLDSAEEAQGVNDLWQLACLERQFQQQQAKQLALSGVRIMDPLRIDIRGDEVCIASGATLDVNVVLEGKVHIGRNTTIGANSWIKNSNIGDDVVILANSVIEGASIGNKAQVGPFARLRTGTQLAEETKIGNFVETKKVSLGKGSKANHLTYLGDAEIGCYVNIGAGTITCNYDGVNKWQTLIKDGAFIGSNTALVAPLTIGANATIGAGSTISSPAPDNQLTVARARQRSIASWKRPLAGSRKNNEL